MNREALVYVVGGAGVGVVAFVLYRHMTEGTVARMKAPFVGEIFPYTLKARHVSSPFNDPRATGPHSGIDLRTLFTPRPFKTPSGTVTVPDLDKPDPDGIAGISMPFAAPFSGTVSQVLSGGSGGNEMILLAEDGTKVGLSHLHTIFVKKNDAFVVGEVLALCGDTGRVTGPHLHLTVRDRNGILVDPAPYLGL
jgi:hypothetical protein